MDPIDLTHPEDADWMQAGRKEERPIRLRDQVNVNEIGESIREGLLPTLKNLLNEVFSEEDLSAEERDVLAREILDQVTDEELEAYYYTASERIDPEEVESLEFVQEIKGTVAKMLIENAEL